MNTTGKHRGAPSAPATMSYAEAGVDVDAGDRAVALMKASVANTHGPRVETDHSGFAGLFDASALRDYRRPLLATSTDGVGTKVAIAQALGIHNTVGYDLVGMVVDDVVVCGAEPLFMTDYIACGKLVPERIAEIVSGISAACVEAGCALIGGETAEHPGLLGADEYDLAGATTGVVEADALLGPDRVQAGDVIIAIGSSGLHSNGYSLVRRVIADAGWSLERHVDVLGRTLGEELLEPTRVYAAHCLALTRSVEVHALAHITGGGLAVNIARALPAHLSAVVDRGTWTPNPVFELIGHVGGVSPAELERAFNMGIGMVAVVPEDAVDEALGLLVNRGLAAWTAGHVESGGTGAAELIGGYPRG